MNILDHFDHHEKKQDKEHFMSLIQVALSDGVVDKAETSMLYRLGRKKGFTSSEIDYLIETTSQTAYSPTCDFFKRFEQIYEIVEMSLADGIIDENEMHLAGRYATKSGFTESEIPVLFVLLINGIKDGKDEEDLFETFKKQRKYLDK